MGFTGDEFLNAVIEVYTTYNSKKSLEVILGIEKKLGRERKSSTGYSSRIIDIDILFFDKEIIQEIELQIPHPEIANRKFVLAPLKVIASDFSHPILGKSIGELLEITSDSSPIELEAQELKNPISEFDISKYRYIAIEGNIGAGKTSLATKMATDFQAKLVLERFKENPFLPQFYKEPERYAFPLEMSFLADRYQQLVDDLNQYDLFSENIIGDYDSYKSLIFAKITLQEEEFNLYKKLFTLMHKDLSLPDKYIYLFQNTERLLQNIKKRGREFEQEIEATYLQKINEGYMEFIRNQHSDNIKIIDISDMDFVNKRVDYVSILKEIFN